MEKIRLYIDTNIIHDLFTKQAVSVKKGIKLETPQKFKFLLGHQNKFDFVTSFLTKAEIMRELVSGHAMTPAYVNEVWADFIGVTKTKYVSEFKFDEQIVDLVSKMPIKLRTMVNFFHIFIAIKEQAYFVSGDKPALEKARELNLYKKLLTYIELQKLASSFPLGDASCEVS